MEGVAGVLFIHLCYTVTWHNLLAPVALCVGLQIGAFMGAYWAGKWAREERRFGPISILVGFSLWGMVLIGMHYGPIWGILPVVGDPLGFSLFMVFVTLISWFTVSKIRPK
jgi:hypothetical protein